VRWKSAEKTAIRIFHRFPRLLFLLGSVFLNPDWHCWGGKAKDSNSTLGILLNLCRQAKSAIGNVSVVTCFAWLDAIGRTQEVNRTTFQNSPPILHIWCSRCYTSTKLWRFHILCYFYSYLNNLRIREVTAYSLDALYRVSLLLSLVCMFLQSGVKLDEG